MNLLLTGATGFVGRNLLLRAIARRWRVYAPVRDPAKLRAQIVAEGVDGSLVESLPADPANWPAHLSVDAAMHCAGALFERDLETYLETNVDWTQRVVSRLPRGCPTVVLSSQSAGGPTPEGQAARSESDPDNPVSDYGESKLRMERVLLRSGRRRLVILRPPMVLGPRDSAELQLFEMARGLFRTKPGWKTKHYSFIACDDLLNAMDVALENVSTLGGRSYYVASMQRFSDIQLLDTAAACMKAKGFNVPLPHALVSGVSRVVDATPSLRKKLPSLGRDRVREILQDRWVVDPTRFSEATGWKASRSLAATLDEACRYYKSAGLLK
jgi:nucleoside-diphosphate-sugar epimerase